MILPLPIRAHCVFGALGRQGEEDPEAFETGSLPVSRDLLPVFLSGNIYPQVARKPPRTSPVSSARAQSLRSIAAWITHRPSLLSLGRTKSFCWLSLLPVWCVCLLLSQSQPVVGQTASSRGPHGCHQVHKTSPVLTASPLLCPPP